MKWTQDMPWVAKAEDGLAGFGIPALVSHYAKWFSFTYGLGHAAITPAYFDDLLVYEGSQMHGRSRYVGNFSIRSRKALTTFGFEAASSKQWFVKLKNDGLTYL